MQNVNRKSRRLVFLFLFVLLLVICFISLCLGRFGFVNVFDLTEQSKIVLWNIRFTRIVCACAVGAGLSVAGAVFQTLFHNPLASPDLLGASSGAGFGAALAILLGFSKSGVTVSAFAVSLFSIVIIYLISKKAHGKSSYVLIVSGILVSAIFSSGISFVKLISDPENKLPEITFWLMGSLAGKKAEDCIFICTSFLVGAIPLFLIRWKINLLSLSSDEAKSLGVNTALLKTVVVIFATILTSASVSVSGLIGWIGIIVPLIARKIFGENCVELIPCSALLGAVFLVVVDTVSRCAFSAEIPIGILMSFIGSPFLIALLLKRKSI